MVVIVVRLWVPTDTSTDTLHGVAELVGGSRATFKNEEELAAFLHHCMSVRPRADDRG